MDRYSLVLKRNKEERQKRQNDRKTKRQKDRKIEN
jgi:hypothetical protein